MRKKRLVSAVLLVLLLAGCGQTGGKLLPSGTGRTDTAAAQAELDVQLGLLKDEITAEERREALDLWSKIRAIQTERKAKGNYERSDYEWRLLRRLSGSMTPIPSDIWAVMRRGSATGARGNGPWRSTKSGPAAR